MDITNHAVKTHPMTPSAISDTVQNTVLNIAAATLEPGRSLDSVIAERVMGYTPRRDLSQRQGFEAVWYAPDGALFGNNPPPYSTHPAAARELAKKLLGSVSFTLTHATPEGPWRCQVQRFETPRVIEGRTLPHALALVALSVAGPAGQQLIDAA